MRFYHSFDGLQTSVTTRWKDLYHILLYFSRWRLVVMVNTVAMFNIVRVWYAGEEESMHTTRAAA